MNSKSRRRFLLDLAALPAAFSMAGTLEAADPPADWVFLDNGTLRLGIKRSSGAGIGWLSASGSKDNLLDHYDHGRLIQQSYYGKPDGSKWVDKPWRWNPVQGGDYKGSAAEVLSLTHAATTLHAKIRPRNWAGGQLLHDCLMEQQIQLDGACAIVRFRFQYTGSENHPVVDHEIPAVFLNPRLTRLVHYQGNRPWTNAPLTRSQPGWPNESRNIPESWAAYVNDQGRGAGVFVPIANTITCYRFGASQDAPSACSYFAPVVQFTITPGLDFSYEAAIAIGKPEEMRQIFASLRSKLAAPALPGAKAGP